MPRGLESPSLPPARALFMVGPAGIAAALSQAHSGDTVVIPQGRYRGTHRTPRRRNPPHPAAGHRDRDYRPIADRHVIARKMDSGGVEGVWIQGDLEAPLATGIEMVDASPFISHVKITRCEYRHRSAGEFRAADHRQPDHEQSRAPESWCRRARRPESKSNLIAANGNGQARRGRSRASKCSSGSPGA